METVIEQGTPKDLGGLGRLYDDLNDHLAATVNYPGWIKGVYPTRRDAETGLANGTLFVAKTDGELSGSIILNHQPEEAYFGQPWLINCAYSHILVVHTLVVHPRHLRHGVGQARMDFALQHAKERGMCSIRLDVYHKNTPAIRLYERSGYQYISTVDLGLKEQYGLDWFRLYERLL